MARTFGAFVLFLPRCHFDTGEPTEHGFDVAGSIERRIVRVFFFVKSVLIKCLPSLPMLGID
ncbi:MAG: hypothetical protein IPJ30_05530 [Acidobacteria bacterium]|nr:hypothetical protein [Acidobacteriota bacterium]